jgi:DNA-binding NarL/FixJ family response regulator
MPTFTVLVIDSSDSVRARLERRVLDCPQLRLVGSAATLVEGLQLIRHHHPDLVVTEMGLVDSRGLDTVRAVLVAQGPRSTLVVSMSDELLYGPQVLALGADGYLMKGEQESELISAALTALQGKRWTSVALGSQIVKRVVRRRTDPLDTATASLTVRELEVLEQLKMGKSTKQIAAALSISPRTVDLYRAKIKKKLRLRTGAELIAFASHHM